jgi:lysozyme family protein
MADFLTAYKRTAVAEGGYADLAGDNGGETYKGIARNFWPKWSGWIIIDEWKKVHGKPKHNATIPDKVLDDRVHSFYKTQFWDKISGDKIRSQAFANEMYDTAVNHGNQKAIKLAQATLDQVQTGRMDISLLDKINNAHAA